MPWYKIERNSANELEQKCSQKVFASKDALKKILTWALHELGEVQGENHVSGADGGLRCAGDKT